MASTNIRLLSHGAVVRRPVRPSGFLCLESQSHKADTSVSAGCLLSQSLISFFMLTPVIGRIQFLMAVGPRSLLPCWLPGLWGAHGSLNLFLFLHMGSSIFKAPVNPSHTWNLTPSSATSWRKLCF